MTRMIILLGVLALGSLACGVTANAPAALPPAMPTVTAESVNTPVHVTTTAPPVYVVVGDWNIRDGASEQSTKRGELRDGQEVTVLFCRPDGWCKINGGFVCGRAVGLAEVCK